MTKWLRIGSDRINLDHVAVIQHFDAVAEESKRCWDQSVSSATPQRMILFRSAGLQSDYYVCEETSAYKDALTFLSLAVWTYLKK